MKFYVTTPIYYVNDKPHIGHTYSTVAADILARYHRYLGDDVFFLTGTDENSQKNVEAAAKVGKQDDIQGYLNEMSGVWEKTWNDLGLSVDKFIRTTSKEHHLGVEKFWQACFEKGDIYEGSYEGMYCTGCEEYKREDDLINGLCPMHKKAPDVLSEKNYFFRLTNYRQALLDYIDANPEFIQPVARRNEVRSYVDKFMTDISVSRETVKWGIPVPGDDNQRIYVWFDALINYLTGVGYGEDETRFNKYWPADVHLVGKDIIKFHCALWPAMLMSVGLPLPKKVFAHGFFTIDGEKISKSLGNAINPIEIAEEYGMDTLRYFLMREITFGEDGDFSLTRLAERYDKELASELGNLLNRVLTMTEKYCDGKIPKATENPFSQTWSQYHAAFLELKFQDVIDAAWILVREANGYIEKQAPWKLSKEGNDLEVQKTMYALLEVLRHIALMLMPIMPVKAEEMLQQLGLDPSSAIKEDGREQWGKLPSGQAIKKGEPLFPRKETL